MKLYWGPHTCAIGNHILLEEIGGPYEIEEIDVGGGETRQPAFLAINPKEKVPTLIRDDGTVLTKFNSIAGWLARTNPHAGLLPSDPDMAARVDEMIAYVEGIVHGQGYARSFVPASFEPQDVIHEKTGLGRPAVKAQGVGIVEEGFSPRHADRRRRLRRRSRLSIADAALFYVERRAAPNGIKLPDHLQTHFEVIRRRPAVRKVLEISGEA